VEAARQLKALFKEEATQEALNSRPNSSGNSTLSLLHIFEAFGRRPTRVPRLIVRR